MEGTLRIQVIHVYSMLMIAHGPYGLSRGLIAAGVMSREDML